jgi:hypothetical protein
VWRSAILSHTLWFDAAESKGRIDWASDQGLKVEPMASHGGARDRWRCASHAGSWYSAKPSELTEQMESWLAAVAPLAAAGAHFQLPVASNLLCSPSLSHSKTTPYEYTPLQIDAVDSTPCKCFATLPLRTC